MARIGETYVTKNMLPVREGFLPEGTEIVVVGRDNVGWVMVAVASDRDVEFEVCTTSLNNRVL